MAIKKCKIIALILDISHMHGWHHHDSYLFQELSGLLCGLHRIHCKIWSGRHNIGRSLPRKTAVSETSTKIRYMNWKGSVIIHWFCGNWYTCCGQSIYANIEQNINDYATPALHYANLFMSRPGRNEQCLFCTPNHPKTWFLGCLGWNGAATIK